MNKLSGAVYAALYRVSGGRLGGRAGAHEIVLLTTTGRRSGELRTVPVAAMPDGDRRVLVASNAGQDHQPAWFLNIEANPAVSIRAGNETFAANARIATDAERAELWPKVTAWWDRYDKYQDKTPRAIPLVIVE